MAYRTISMLVCLAAFLLHVAVAEEVEEDKASPSSVAIALTLLGSVSFMMILYYFTNHPDEDMKKYTYDVISQTISIFCAVLMFQACNDLTEYFFGLEESPIWFQLLIDICQLIFWYVILQVSLAVISGALDEYGFTPKNIESADLNSQCFAVLLAHMTGFASINAFGTMQQLAIFRCNWWMSALVVPIAMQILFAVERFTARVREHIMLADDGEKDDYEELWDESTAEAEDDIMGLTVSFLSVQSIKYGICGFLANQEGVEPWDVLSKHGFGQSFSLYSMAVIFAVGTIVFYLRVPANTKEGKEELDMHEELEGNAEEEARQRKIEVARQVLGMSYAWANFYAVKWYMASFTLVQHDRMLLAVLLAMLLSFSSFALIRCLDWLADLDFTPQEIDAAIVFFIKAIGVLVGFSWEQCFDEATACLSSVVRFPHTTKTALAVFCGLIIVPAWRIYILPMARQEGWKFGFVISADDGEKWAQIIQDNKFKKMVQTVHKTSMEKHRESMAVKGYRRTKTMEVIDSIKNVAQAHGARMSCVGSAVAQAEFGALQTEYEQLPSDEVEELKLKYQMLEKTLAAALASYQSHMEKMHSMMSKMAGKLPDDGQFP